MGYMRCDRCGEQIPNNVLFCDNCGQKVMNNKNSEKFFCDNCGAELTSGMRFCGECGALVETAQSLIRDKHKKKNRLILIIVLLIAVIVFLLSMITVYMLYSQNNKSTIGDVDNLQNIVVSTPMPQGTISPTMENNDNISGNENISSKYMVSDRVDLYNSSLTYKRMSEIHNTVIVDDDTFYKLKNVINEFNMQCTDYMNEITNEVPSYLKPETTAYNQQVEYKKNHPTLNQTYQTVDVINARQGGGYYYVWVTEVLDITENDISRTDICHWVYKLENNNGQWYICDYTADPAF